MMIKGILFLTIAGVLFLGCTSQPKKTNNDPWDQVYEIISKLDEPVFPDRSYSVLDFGAVPDGAVDCSDAFKRAIEECAKSGGGKVVVPKGTYFTGPIYLQSHVNLHLEDGATIRFSIDPADYLPVVYTRWEGVEMMGYSPLIYAFEEENIALTGKGFLDGQASESNWWTWKGRREYGWSEGKPSQKEAIQQLLEMAEAGVPVAQRIFGKGSYLRPQFFQPYRCKNVLVKDVTFLNSPMWVMHPVLSENVIIDHVTVESNGPNSDGCDPESSKNVWIKNCYFNTGDDCIAIKSGRNHDGRRVDVPSENIIIQNCVMKSGHGGVVIGSEASGGVRNVFAENCVMDSPLLDRAVRLKTSSQRGGFIENVYVRNVEVGQVKEAVLKINMFYGDPGDFIPSIRNIFLENVTVERGGTYGVWVKAYEESPVENLVLSNVRIENVEKPLVLEHVKSKTFSGLYINGKEIKGEN